MKPSNTAKSSQFTIDMDLKGLVVFLTLVALTGATLFYLGLTYGKASRSANQKIELPGLAATESELSPPKDLKIYNLGGGGSGGLQKEFDSLKSKSGPSLAEETQQVESRIAENKIATESAVTLERESARKAAPPEPVQTTATPAPAKAEVSWPDIVKDTASTKKTETYTIQILSTSQKAKADRMVSSLKQKGFPAYIASINLEGRQLYRVRVAKDTRANIAKMKVRLSNVVQGIGSVQVVQAR